MKVAGTPEQALAVAVLVRVVDDLRKGAPDKKRQARHDVRKGGLNVWVEMACEEFDMGERVKAELRKMAEL